MSWNHRVIATKQDDPDNPYYYSIHEVHYRDDGAVEGWTVEPIPVGSEDLEGLRWTLAHMLKCLDKPVLYEHELEAEMEARRQAREDTFQQRYGQMTVDEKLQALNQEIEELCPVTQDGKHCHFKAGHPNEHEFSEPDEMLRNQLWIEYYPLHRLRDLKAEWEKES